MVALRHWHFTK